MMMETQTTNKQIIEIPEEKTYLKAEIKEIWTPHIIIAKNVSDMDVFLDGGYIKVIETGKEISIWAGYPWRINLYDSEISAIEDELELFIDAPYLNRGNSLKEKLKEELLFLISLNDLKDKKPGDIIIQKRLGENHIFSFHLGSIFYPSLFYDLYFHFVDRLYKTIDPKEFPYLKIYVTLRCAEISFKTIRNIFYRIFNGKDPELITKINDLLNKDRDAYITKYFLAHFKEDDYLKKEFFEAKYIIELYKVLESEPIRFYDRWDHSIKSPKDPYRDIQKLKKKIENDLKNSLIYKAIRSYGFSLK